MAKDNEVFEDKNNEMLEDKWLSENLSQIVMMPTESFTKEVVEKLDITPKQKWDSPIFWILILVPLTFIITGFVFTVIPILNACNINLGFSLNNYSFLAVSKTVLLIALTGVGLIIIDYFINRGVSKRSVVTYFLSI
mgnify:CR=1 FL=1